MSAKPPSQALQEEGLAWVNRLLSGEATTADAEALEFWRKRSPAHEQAFADAVRLRSAVRAAVQAERAQAAAPHVASASSPRRRRASFTLAAERLPHPSRRALVGGALAASVGGYLLVRPPAGLWPSLAELTSDFHTGVGQTRDVKAAPGVSIALNTSTSVALQHTAGHPGIALLSGEAEISARRPASSPFTVLADNGRTLVSDATLDIRKTRYGVCVTCLKGEAIVQHGAVQAQLTAGQQLIYSHRGLDTPMKVDTALATAWRQGLLIFRDTPLQQVVDELNRYRRGKIVLMDAALAERPVYGVFQLRQIDRAVQQVQRLTGAKAVHLPGDIIILS